MSERDTARRRFEKFDTTKLTGFGEGADELFERLDQAILDNARNAYLDAKRSLDF